MRTLCDVCEKAAAILFCAADEAALCRSCDEKVHLCNKLASRHVRVGLAEPSEVPRCDICESAPAFFYCEVDGSSLCLQCDMIVHVGGKRTHGRYLLLRQKVEFLGDKPLEELGGNPEEATRDFRLPHRQSPGPSLVNNNGTFGKAENKLFDLNTKPQKISGQTSNNQEHGVDMLMCNNYESSRIVPVGTLKRDLEKK